jgi:hypothetical protein
MGWLTWCGKKRSKRVIARERTGLFTVEKQVERLKRNINSVRYLNQIDGRKRKQTSYLRLPSLNFEPQLQGMISPPLVFCIKTTGLIIPGTAADANKALQIMQSGPVR